MESPAKVGVTPAAAPLARVAAILHIAPEGAAMVAGIAGVGVLFLVLGVPSAGFCFLVIAAATGAFFRDPERRIPVRDDIVLSAADGRVVDVAQGHPADLEEGRLRRVSVFMSPLNVHVNRASVAADVLQLKHTPGEFSAAFRDYAGEHNERNLIVLRDCAGRRHIIVQIAGYLARRIVCRLHVNERVEAGQRIGIIMFGSRVDHFLPPEYRVTARVGDRVRAGESVIGELAP